MNCRNDCQYYMEHDFMDSAYKCLLNKKSYTKGNKMECIMSLIIEEKKEELVKLEEYILEIKEKQAMD